jgi:hypothetical protein
MARPRAAKKIQTRRERKLSARILRRDAVDLELLADAFVGLALARTEKQAQQQRSSGGKA